ncbi:MAG: hypothetical protein J5493_06000 [Lachnospiraceae bacterium]|nr:hypothetical protein [Lachnospiraceae bacterium]
MLTAGSMVYYGLNGVCCVMGTVEKNFDGSLSRYYELHPYFRKNEVIFLPENNEALLAHLRPLISREDIDVILRDCPQTKCPWPEPEPVRRDAFKTILRSGDQLEIIRLIRTLYERKTQLTACGKKLRTSDTAFLKDAERLLNEEFAFVLEIPPAEVPAYIREHMPE